MAKKPKGFGAFDELARKLVKVPPGELPQVHVNTRGCKPMSAEAAKAIGEAAKKLAAAYRRKSK